VSIQLVAGRFRRKGKDYAGFESIQLVAGSSQGKRNVNETQALNAKGKITQDLVLFSSSLVALGANDTQTKGVCKIRGY